MTFGRYDAAWQRGADLVVPTLVAADLIICASITICGEVSNTGVSGIEVAETIVINATTVKIETAVGSLIRTNWADFIFKIEAKGN